MTVSIKLVDDGPLLLTGDVVVTDGAGAAYPAARVVSLCRCGLSDDKPFCDGSHRVKRFAHKARVADAG
jgi:CDGSH-type Zn-finger protein